MSSNSRSILQGLYGAAGTTFPDNTSGDIHPVDVRSFGQDVTDSSFNLSDDKYTGAQGIYLNVASLSDLKALTTVGVQVNILVFFQISLGFNCYQLVSGTNAETSPTILRPNDYNSSTNTKAWKQVLPSSAGTISGNFVLTKSAVSFSSNQNDFNIGTGGIIKMSTDDTVTRSLTGLSGGSDGRVIICRNYNTTAVINFNNEDSGSSAANRIHCSTGSTLSLNPAKALQLYYDIGISRWVDISF